MKYRGTAINARGYSETQVVRADFIPGTLSVNGNPVFNLTLETDDGREIPVYGARHVNSLGLFKPIGVGGWFEETL